MSKRGNGFQSAEEPPHASCSTVCSPMGPSKRLGWLQHGAWTQKGCETAFQANSEKTGCLHTPVGHSLFRITAHPENAGSYKPFKVPLESGEPREPEPDAWCRPT